MLTGRPWTIEEDNFLQEHYLEMGYAEIAQTLGRSSASIRNRCYERKLRKASPNWTVEEDELLRQLYGKFDETVFLDSVAERLGRSRAGVADRASKLGIAHYGRPKSLGQVRKRQCSPGQFAQTRNGRGASTNGGFREDIGIYVRSTWEANYARYLNWLKANGHIVGWEYEPDTFQFPVKRGTRFYTPDFKVMLDGGMIEYHEVKGYMSPKSATALKRMARHYPQLKVVLIDGPTYKDIRKKVGSLIQGWENPPALPIWTEEQERLLLDLWARGVPKAEVAILLGKSVVAVSVRANRLGARRPPGWNSAMRIGKKRGKYKQLTKEDGFTVEAWEVTAG